MWGLGEKKCKHDWVYLSTKVEKENDCMKVYNLEKCSKCDKVREVCPKSSDFERTQLEVDLKNVERRA